MEEFDLNKTKNLIKETTIILNKKKEIIKELADIKSDKSTKLRVFFNYN